MLALLVRPLRLLVQALAAADSPRQLAYGFALGMMIGLVPKGNLIALALALLLLVTRANLAAGGVAAVAFSWLGVWLDPLSHRLGLALLTKPSLQPTWAWLYDLPLMPWTGFHNTVVLGSLLVGLWLFYPSYRLSLLGFQRFQPPVAEWIARHQVTRILFGLDVATGWRAR